MFDPYDLRLYPVHVPSQSGMTWQYPITRDYQMYTEVSSIPLDPRSIYPYSYIAMSTHDNTQVTITDTELKITSRPNEVCIVGTINHSIQLTRFVTCDSKTVIYQNIIYSDRSVRQSILWPRLIGIGWTIADQCHSSTDSNSLEEHQTHVKDKLMIVYRLERHYWIVIYNFDPLTHEPVEYHRYFQIRSDHTLRVDGYFVCDSNTDTVKVLCTDSIKKKLDKSNKSKQISDIQYGRQKYYDSIPWTGVFDWPRTDCTSTHGGEKCQALHVHGLIHGWSYRICPPYIYECHRYSDTTHDTCSPLSCRLPISIYKI